jgi:AraC family transcriptional regulator of adaptative response / DNA-3-methyladenine glycosylase II
MNNEVFERARLSRDPSFDGQFFVAVKTTGIYCRPICPANSPKSDNVSFFRTAAAAGEAGYRPCLRCRPECAPGTPAWAGTSTTVQRGLRLIAEGALDEGNVDQLAARLGVTSRHLRRLFTRHLGASPLAVAHTQRLHFAKALLDQTSLPMREIAVASGFGSTRRFNDTFRKTYGRAPRELRRARESDLVDSAFSVQLAYRQPFDWPALLEFFAARATPGVEQVCGDRYLRTITVGDERGIIDVCDVGGKLLLKLHGIATTSLVAAVQCVRGLFDLDAAIGDVHQVLSRDTALARMLKARPGIRVPGAWDGFELTVRAILGQQVSVRAATTLAARVANRYGPEIDVAISGLQQVPNRLFPGPGKLRRARLESLGITGSRARSIRAVAKATADGHLCFDAAQDPEAFVEALKLIPGIGDWTAQYVAMRALKNPDAFPAADLGLLRAFDTEGRKRMKPAELLQRAEAWRPWRAYAALLIWGSSTGVGG